MILNTKPKVIVDENRNTSVIVLLFHSYIEYDENPTYLKLISQFLTTCNNKYPEYVEWKNKKDNLYIIGYNCTIRIMGRNLVFKFSLEVPNEGIIDDFNLDDAFSFFMDNIFDPFQNDNKFNEKRFADEKAFLLSKFEQSIKGFEATNYNKMLRIIDKNNHLNSNIDEILECYHTLTSEMVYKEYESRIKNNDFLVYTYGTLKEEDINRLFNKYHKYNYKDLDIKTQFFDIFANEKYQLHLDKTTYGDSALYLQYQVEDYKESEANYLNLITNILNVGENNLLFNSLRVENNLVYGIYIDKFLYNGFFLEEVYLAKSKKDKVLEVIDETFKKLEDADYLQECINKLFKGYEVEIIESSDGDYYDFDNKMKEDFGLPTLESILAEYKTFKIEDILAFIKRIKLANVLFIEGEEND